MKKVFSILAFLCAVSMSMAQSVSMTEIVRNMPDSVMPMLTKNNRLDFIDFLESNMQARVRNSVDEYVEMTELTPRYTSIITSGVGRTEIALLSDSVICLVRTVEAPVADSYVEFYDTQWVRLNWIEMPSIAVSEFWSEVPDSVAEDARYAQLAMEELPLIEMRLDKESPVLEVVCHTSALLEEHRKLAEQYVHPLKLRFTTEYPYFKKES